MENLRDVDGQCNAYQSIHGSNSHVVLFSGCILVVVLQERIQWPVSRLISRL